MHMQNLVKFHQFILKILRGNEVGIMDNLNTVYPQYFVCRGYNEKEDVINSLGDCIIIWVQLHL